MRILSILIVLIIWTSSKAQSNYYFDNFYKLGSNFAFPVSIDRLPDSSYIAYGTTQDSISGRLDCGLIRIEKNGNILNKKTINHLNTDYYLNGYSSNSYSQISNYSFLISAVNYYYPTSPNTIIIAKYNYNTLDTIKCKYLNVNYGSSGNGLVKINNNKFFLVGTKTNTLTNTYYPNIKTIDSSLNILNDIDIAFTNSIIINNAIKIPGTNKIFIIGEHQVGSNYKGIAMVIDTLGSIQNFDYNNSSIDNYYTKAKYSYYDNTIYVVGNRFTSMNGGYGLYRMQITKLNVNNLQVIWQKTYGKSNIVNYLYDIIINNDGSAVAAGSYSDSLINPLSTRNYNAVILKVNSNGDSLWMKQFDHNNQPGNVNNWYEQFTSIVKNPYGGYTMLGNAYQMPNAKAWVISVDSLGCFNPSCTPYISGVYENSNNTYDFKLYPQPADNKINIELSEHQNINRVQILNTIGQLIREEDIQLKDNTATLQLNDLPNGVYTLCLKSSEGIVLKKKMVIGR